MNALDLDHIRAEFPALAGSTVFLDNAGGSQVLKRVADRVHEYLLSHSVQLGASYAQSQNAGEKVLGARRAGITTIVLCEKNRKDIMEDLPDEVRENMRFEFVTDVSQVLDLALEAPADSQAKETAQANDTGSSQTAARSSAKKPRQTPKAQPLPGVVPNPSAIH